MGHFYGGFLLPTLLCRCVVMNDSITSGEGENLVHLATKLCVYRHALKCIMSNNSESQIYLVKAVTKSNFIRNITRKRPKFCLNSAEYADFYGI